ncbi:MAG: cell division protein [Hyphomicrobiales bacterium]|nr:MAG: cell division protein [Hyphomicrobiales bacterium]
MSDTKYCYPPDFTVLKNKLDLRNARDLAFFETEFVMQRIAEGVPAGNFDLAHLRAIHRHLFQDVYDWAGEIRTVEISKGGHQFQFRRFIETGMADIHRRLEGQQFLCRLSAEDFAVRAGEILGDVNYVHPFREGNGRVQLLYLEQLAQQAGHPLDLTRLERDEWMAASREAHFGRYEAMSRCISVAVDRME